MNKRQPQFRKTQYLVFGAATLMLLGIRTPVQAQTTAPAAPRDRQEDRQAVDSDNITRRDLARFDQFLDSHREIAEQLRRTPSLVDDPQFLQNHAALKTYLQEHPGVQQAISQRPDTFMRLEDTYRRDSRLRDRDAAGHDRDADRRDVANDRDTAGHDRDADRRDVANDRDAAGHDRDADRRDVASLDRFLDGHREIAEQVRKDPSLLDNRNFVQNHPALQTYLQDNPGVREQLRQDPNAFMRQESLNDRDSHLRDREPMPEHMASFGGFLGSHTDIRRDLSRDASVVKNHEYVQNHAELNTYLNAHPEVRDELMANPQKFVQGAQQYNNGGGTGTVNGSGVNGRVTGTTGSSTGTSTNRATTTPKPNQ